MVVLRTGLPKGYSLFGRCQLYLTPEPDFIALYYRDPLQSLYALGKFNGLWNIACGLNPVAYCGGCGIGKRGGRREYDDGIGSA